MFQVDEKPETLETIHLYVVREGEKRPSLFPAILSFLALSLLIAFSALLPYQQPEIQTAIRVPAVLLPLKTFRVSVSVTPTGTRTYPATSAHGTLTLTNGSILSEELPRGAIFTGKDGVEVVTDAAVFVPPGSASAFGAATVSAHAVIGGLLGNIQALDIDQVVGTSLYIRNLQDFTGGKESYQVRFITFQDRLAALARARQSLNHNISSGLLQAPCRESTDGDRTIRVSWSCRFVTYEAPQLPGLKVLHVTVAGRVVVLDIVYVERPRRLTGK